MTNIFIGTSKSDDEFFFNVDKPLFENIIDEIYRQPQRQYFNFGLVSYDITLSARVHVEDAESVIATKYPQHITEMADHVSRAQY